MKKTTPWFVAILLVSLTVLSGCSIPQFPNTAAAAQSAASTPTVAPVVQAPASAGAVAALEGTLEQIYTQVNMVPCRHIRSAAGTL